MRKLINNPAQLNQLSVNNAENIDFTFLERRFGLSPDQIQNAIAAVGNSREKVEEYFTQKLFSFTAYKPN